MTSAPQVPVLTVKKLKSCRGTDGDAFSCDLYVDGKKAATVTQGGHGGCNDYYWFDKGAEKRVDAWIATLPEEEVDLGDGHKFMMETDLDIVLADIIDKMEDENTQKGDEMRQFGLDFRTIHKQVIETGKERVTMDNMDSEADFIAGAAAALTEVIAQHSGVPYSDVRHPAALPPSWYVSIMSGRSLMGLEPKSRRSIKGLLGEIHRDLQSIGERFDSEDKDRRDAFCTRMRDAIDAVESLINVVAREEKFGS